MSENNQVEQLSDEQLIAATLSALEAPSMDEDLDGELPSHHSGAEPEQMDGAPMSSSPTLQSLEATRRPQAATVCEACPNSVWFTTPTEVKCYCRVMYLITWTNKEPTQFTGCDGQYIGQEQ